MGLLREPPAKDDALVKLGLRRTVVLTTPRFLVVPSPGRLFTAELGLSFSPPPVEPRDIAISILWHASYDHDPAHPWLRRIVVRLVAEL